MAPPSTPSSGSDAGSAAPDPSSLPLTVTGVTAGGELQSVLTASQQRMEGMVSRIEQTVMAMNSQIQVVTASHAQLVTLNARMFERQQTLEQLLAASETSRTHNELTVQSLASRLEQVDASVAKLAASFEDVRGKMSMSTAKENVAPEIEALGPGGDNFAALTARLAHIDGSVEGIRAHTENALARIDTNLAARLERVESEMLKNTAFKATVAYIGAGLCLVSVAGAAVSLVARTRGRLLVRAGDAATAE